jgi:hypothetical protein
LIEEAVFSYRYHASGFLLFVNKAYGMFAYYVILFDFLNSGSLLLSSSSSIVLSQTQKSTIENAAIVISFVSNVSRCEQFKARESVLSAWQFRTSDMTIIQACHSFFFLAKNCFSFKINYFKIEIYSHTRKFPIFQ